MQLCYKAYPTRLSDFAESFVAFHERRPAFNLSEMQHAADYPGF